MILNGKQSKQSVMKALMLFLFFLICFVSFSSAEYSDCNVYGNCKPLSSGTNYYNNSYTTINNTYINQTVNATVNSTQFDSNNPITISINWLSSLYCKLTGCTMEGNINMGSNNITSVRMINLTTVSGACDLTAGAGISKNSTHYCFA